MEPDNVAGENSLQDDVLPWEDLDHVPRGERDVKEEANLAAETFSVANLRRT